MSAPALQVLAAFVVDASWQIALLAAAAWFALRVGRPAPRVACALLIATLGLSFALPVLSAVQGYRVAKQDAEASRLQMTYGADDFAGPIPTMLRQPAWKRLLGQHLSLSRGVRPFAWSLPVWLAAAVSAAYLVLFAVSLVQLMLAYARSRRLLRDSAAEEVPRALTEAIDQRCAAAGCAALPVALCDAVRGPALVGVMRPTLLLPQAMLAETAPQEMEAALAHEVAHIRRRDPLLHAACTLLITPLRFHPAACWMANRIRQTREMACDAEAAAAIGSAAVYAHALLSIAEKSQGRPLLNAAAPGLFLLGLFDGAPSSQPLQRYGKSTRPDGLELLNHTGAMEERMKMMMSTPALPKTFAARAARFAAPLVVAALSLTVAGMLQMQPILAAQAAAPEQKAKPGATANVAAVAGEPQEVAVPLIGGAHVRSQLRDASRRLEEARGKATSDEERSKIAAAQEAIRTAQAEIAREGSRDSLGTLQLNLAPLQLHLEQLDAMKGMQLQLPDLDKLKIQLDTLAASHEAMRREDMEHLRESLSKMRLDTEAAQRARAEFETPEFREKLRKQMEAARAINREQIEAAMADANRAREQAMKQLRENGLLVARNETIVSAPEDATQPRQPGAPVKISAGILASNNTYKATPKYPPAAKEAKIQGEVLLHVIVDETGKVTSLAVISSPDKSLSDSAIDAVKDWTYKPYLLNGQPIAVESTVTVHYSFGG